MRIDSHAADRIRHAVHPVLGFGFGIKRIRSQEFFVRKLIVFYSGGEFLARGRLRPRLIGGMIELQRSANCLFKKAVVVLTINQAQDECEVVLSG